MTDIYSATEQRVLVILLSYLEMLKQTIKTSFLLVVMLMYKGQTHKRIVGGSSFQRHRIRQLNIFRLIHESDLACFETTRMNRRCFTILCHMLKTTGKLRGTTNVEVEEMVAIFLHILAHDVKNRVVRRNFVRSGETISRYFNIVLNSVLRLHELLLKKPEPVPANSLDEKWRWFKVTFSFYIQLNHIEILISCLN